jgi:hypothetical protein
LYKYYFNLQRKRFERWVHELGLPLWLAYLLIPIFLTLFVEALFIKTTFPAGILSICGLYYPAKLSEEHRTDFLQSLFAENFIKIRILENLIVSSPFIFALLIKMQFLYATSLLLSIIALSFLKGRSLSSKSYNKLFSKYPFEFTSNIRLTGPIFLLSYFLCGIGLCVENYNLSAFSLGLIFFMTMMFYANQEVKYFIWIYDKSVYNFIKHKFMTGAKYSLTAALVIIISICWFAPQFWYIVLIIVVCGLANLLNIIIIKYGVYPKEYGLFDSLAIVLCIIMPPLLLLTIPYYYKKLSTSIKPLLS